MPGNWRTARAAALRSPRTASPRGAASTLLLLLLPLQLELSSAEPVRDAQGATGRFDISISVLPTFEVREIRPVQGGHEYRVWTNMASVTIKGREYRFDKVGEATIMVPGAAADGRESLGAGWQRAVGAMAPAPGGTSPQASSTPAGDGSNATRVTVTY
ncbi:hypothetical protein EJO68_33575 [Variovorax atrisoli]|uniref:hypothetical protein n=1 Tax=Variovorax atrisoli TaxID=3394203 RepID=UPI000F7E3E80|nr:hypothetical protein [Variovorax sp. 369]RTD83856.1 hypothetical protein EJO68_33575 [Variovorax sp. 369]